MCGIAGFWNMAADDSQDVLCCLGTAMTNTLVSRGPDSGGLWLDPSIGLALGHRRLAIRDLSPSGAQPMATANDRHVLVYNGELYNGKELQKELTERHGVRFSGSSDAEIVLHGCAQWGVDELVSRSIGSLAFAFWDASNRRLMLARDHLGVKPLYYAMRGRVFLFGSELKALCAHTAWQASISRESLAEFLGNGYIMAPRSIYEDVYKLEPGSILELDPLGEPRIRKFWDARAVMLEGQSNIISGDENDIIDQTEELLMDAVKKCMQADVPLGAFLSGGIDSSLIVALMQAQSSSPIKTFCIGFEEEGYNEAPFAKAVADHLGTNHIEQYMPAREAWERIPQLPVIYDEPFADSSQLPTWLLCEITRKHVPLALSGDAGDELFAGYGRYFLYGANLGPIPAPLARGIGKILNAVPEQCLNRAGRLFPQRYRDNFAERLENLIARSAADVFKRYKSQLALWQDPALLVRGVNPPFCGMDDVEFLSKIHDHIGRMQAADTLCYLPDDCLVKVDRASMAASLETRVPLLDHRVFSHAWRLPLHMKVRDGKGKWILRQILRKYVPDNLFERPKMGFGVPIDIWLRGPLREWAESLITEDRLRREGFIEPELVRTVWDKHQNGENHCYALWSVLMFQAWLEHKTKDGVIDSQASMPLTIRIADSKE